MPRSRNRSDRMSPEAECPSGSVACMLCGRYFYNMGPHLTRSHGITARQYRERFPGAVTVCQEAREQTRAAGQHGREVFARMGGRRHTVTYAVA